MPTDEERTRLRQMLGERIPAGGSAEDTLFSDSEMDGFITESGSNLLKAAYQGWLAKVAELSNLVDTTEGNYSRKFGQLLDQARRMADHYGQASGSTRRSRVGSIKRESNNYGAQPRR